MTPAEYYGFPEGAKVNFQYINFYDSQEDNYPCPSNMDHAYSDEKRTVVKPRDTSNVTDMGSMFYYCENLTSIPPFDTGNVTRMYCMFYYCKSLTSIPPLDTSNVTSMEKMFYTCSALRTIPPLDTSNVTNMNDMFASCSLLRTIPPLQASKVSFGSYNGPFSYGNMTNLKDFGGLIGLKSSLTNYGFEKCPNLTYESCINILNGLYDFTGNGQTPTSSQGKLKVHANFLTAVGDEIEIATSRGWVISS